LLEEVLSDPKAKVIVWSVWVDTIKLLTERYKKYNALPYFGEIDMEDRRRYETLFKDDDRYRVLVANPVVAGLGLNLQRARVAIHVDRSEKLLVNQQSDGRITRRDAIGTAVIIDLVGKDTIDEWLYEILKKKEDMQKSVLDPDAIPIDIEITSLEKYLRSPNGKGVDSSSSNIPKGLSLQNTLNS
jgi:SNF2 family DNA or RNA helicase